MSKLGPHSGKEVVAGLGRLGFTQASQKGSQVKMRHPDGRVAIVPMHGEVALGTLRSILRQAGITADELAGVL